MFRFAKKHNKSISWLIILSVLFSLGMPVLSDTPDDGEKSPDSDKEEEAVSVAYDVPMREEDELLKLMGEPYAETDTLALYVLDKYEYTGIYKDNGDLILHDKDGNPVNYVEGMFVDPEDETRTKVPLYDEAGKEVIGADGKPRTASVNDLNEVEETVKDDEGNDVTVTRLTYKGVVSEPQEGKIKEEGIFAVKNKKNGYIWWSNPINASLDTSANTVQVATLASPLAFLAGNPVENITTEYRAVTTPGGSGVDNYDFKSACKSIDKISNGAKFNYNFPSAFTTISMEVTLEDDSVLVRIPQDGIKESRITPTSENPKEASTILSMSLLNSFGAAAKGEDGYIVVADGSGAVIKFDNGKTSAKSYSGQVYGRDYATFLKMAPPVNQQVYLPVFGIVRDKQENALVAIAEDGDENATIRAAVSNSVDNTTSYNLAWFDFRMRTVDSFFIGTSAEELKIYETGYLRTGDIAVRYYPLAAESGKKLSYADVASKYSDYLETQGVEKKNNDKELPFFMTLNGGTIKTTSVLGIPMDLQTKATTYSQAEKMVADVNKAGIVNAVIAYNDVNTSSIKRQITDELEYSKKLGSKKDFKSLMSSVDKCGYSLYPSFNFMLFDKSGNGYSYMRNAAREVTKSRALVQRFELAFGTPDTLVKPSTILSPYYFNDVINSISKSVKKEGVKTVSLGTATTMLYSDFSRKNPFGKTYFNRRDTVQILTEAFEKLNGDGVTMLAQGANAYALPYVDYINDIPLSSSDYDIFDYDVPFYQMAVGRLIPCAANPFNESADMNALTLLALSTATPVHYEFLYSSPGNFNDSEYNKKFYADYDGWFEQAVNSYKMFNDLVGEVAGERITEHNKLSDNEYETVFEGGMKIYINLLTNEIKINGEAVDLSAYNLELSGGTAQ